MLEQAKRGTPKTSECTFILPLSCLLSCSIRLLSLVSTNTPQQPGIFALSMAFSSSSTFNQRLPQISFNMPTDKVDDLFEFSKKIEIDSLNYISRFRVSRKQIKQKKKLLLEKDTYDYVQINIADITK